MIKIYKEFYESFFPSKIAILKIISSNHRHLFIEVSNWVVRPDSVWFIGSNCKNRLGRASPYVIQAIYFLVQPNLKYIEPSLTQIIYKEK